MKYTHETFLSELTEILSETTLDFGKIHVLLKAAERVLDSCSTSEKDENVKIMVDNVRWSSEACELNHRICPDSARLYLNEAKKIAENIEFSIEIPDISDPLIDLS
jgi:hypothetical protein